MWSLLESSTMRTFFYAIVIKQSSEQLCLPLLSVKYQNMVFPWKSHRWGDHQHTKLCCVSISHNCRQTMHINLENPFPTQEMSLHWQPAAAAATYQLWLKKCSRQACRIQYSSSIWLPEPILCCFETWATSCEEGIQLTWKENLAVLKSMVEVSFSLAEPGYHSWQLPICCLYWVVFLLENIDLGWEEAVALGIDYVTKSRPREFISSKHLPPLISKEKLKTFLPNVKETRLLFQQKPLNLDAICKPNQAVRKGRFDEVVPWAVDRPWGKGLAPNLWKVSGQLMLLLTQILLTDRAMDATLKLESPWCAALHTGH